MSVLKEFIDLFDDDYFNFSIVNKGNVFGDVKWKKDESEIICYIPLPGLKKDDIKVEVDGNVLIVKHTGSDNFDTWYSSKTRKFSLPRDIVKYEISSQYKDGVLKIVLPRDKGMVEKSVIKVEVE